MITQAKPMPNDDVPLLAGGGGRSHGDGVVAGVQQAEEYSGAFWKYSTRQVEFSGGRSAMLLKTGASSFLFTHARVPKQLSFGRVCELNRSLELRED